MSRHYQIWAVLLSALVLGGCQQQQIEMPLREVVGYSVQSRPIEQWTLGRGDDVTLILATIHGNENAGTPLVYQFVNQLRRRKDILDERKVIVIPVVNPDGYEVNIRSYSRGIDLNRNFAATNSENNRRYGVTRLSEVESRIIVRLLEQHKPDRIVVLHQPFECIDWDGPGHELAKHMGKVCYMPVRRVGARPGSLGSYAGEDLQIPIITYELPRNADQMPLDVLTRLFAPALMAAVTYPKLPDEFS